MIAGALVSSALAAVLVAVPAVRAEVALTNAWMRPAYAGQTSAQVYVDVRAERPLRLVAASAPVARRAELVLVDPPSNDPTTHRVVAELPVAGGGETRLALGGSHVRLVEVSRDVWPGESWPLELAFVDAAGKRVTANAEVLVRGLMARRPEGTPQD